MLFSEKSTMNYTGVGSITSSTFITKLF